MTSSINERPNKTCIVQCRITADEKAALQLVIDKNQPAYCRQNQQSTILRGLIRDYIAYYTKGIT
jgi:hypothetical protein